MNRAVYLLDPSSHIGQILLEAEQMSPWQVLWKFVEKFLGPDAFTRFFLLKEEHDLHSLDLQDGSVNDSKRACDLGLVPYRISQAGCGNAGADRQSKRRMSQKL